MPLRIRKRRINRRKPVVRRRKMALVKRINTSRSGIHYFTRRYVVANITASTTGLGVQNPASGALSFNLAALPNASEFTALFDQYKLMNVKLDFVPFGDTVNLPISTMTGTSSVLSPGGPLILAVDYDDNTTPADAASLLQYQNSKVVPIPRRHRMTIRPKFATEVYRSGVSTGYGARTGWLDCANSDVPHYGVKYYMNAPSANSSSYTYQVWANVTIAVKGVL